MKKKHYEAIGEQIRLLWLKNASVNGRDHELVKLTILELVDALAKVFSAENSKFQRNRFFETCGISANAELSMKVFSE
jgi:hypothetical protein